MNDDFVVPQEVQEELTRLRKKNRFYTVAFLGLLTVGILSGTVMYARQQANAEMSKYFGAYYNAEYTATNGNTAGGAAGGAAGSGCGGSAGGGASGSAGGCGSGSAGGCGGGGGSGGSILQQAGVTLADLEKQGLAAFVKETGNKNVVVKAKDYGCHIQVDIYDANNQMLRSYGFKGEALYVIK